MLTFIGILFICSIAMYSCDSLYKEKLNKLKDIIREERNLHNKEIFKQKQKIKILEKTVEKLRA